VPVDNDPDDHDSVRVFSQLLWQSETTFVAYEDLKNTGWSDWDYNDLVVRIDVNKGLTADGDLATLIINYEALARGAAYDHNFIHNLPLEGGGQAELVVRNANQQIVTQNSYTFNDNTDFSIFSHTAQALPSAPGFFNTNTSTTQPQIIRGYTATLTINLNDPSANPASLLPPLPWDPYIKVYNTNQIVHLVIPGHLDNTQIVNGVHDPGNPMLGYDLPLAQTFYPGWKWPLEFAGIWRGYPYYANFIGSGGTTYQDWYAPEYALNQGLWTAGVGAAPPMASLASAATAPRYFASPTVADLNGDGLSEIIIGTLLTNQIEVYNARGQIQPGWPQTVGKDVKATAAVADLGKDGDLEIIVGAGDGKLYAWHHNGQPVAGWPVTLVPNFRILATPAIADLDGDGSLDIVVPLANGKLYGFNANGTAKSGWPVSLGNIEDLYESQVINSSPRIADVDGDGSLEIIVGSTDKKLYVFNSNGALRWSYTTGDLVFSTPAGADFDAARPGLEIAFGSGDSYVYLLDKNGSLLWKKRTGWTIRSSATAADLDGNSDLEILIGGDDNKLWAFHHTGSLVNGWPQTTGADLFSSPAVGDIDGDGTPEVVSGSDDAPVYAWHANGDPATGWPHATNLSVKGTPALANLDDDPALEVIAGDFGGVLNIWNFSGVLPDNAADLSLSMSGPGNPVELDSVITYTVAITNNGPSMANVVILTDTLPSGLAFLGASASQGNCAITPGTILCSLAAITSGAQANVTLTLRANLPKTFAHRVSVASTQPDPNPNNNVAEVTTSVSLGRVIDANLDNTVVYTDSVAGHQLQVWVPAGAVTDTLTLHYSLATTPATTSTLRFAGRAFHLDAYDNETPQEHFTFRHAVTLTLNYSDTDVIGLNENDLHLYYWDVTTSTWLPAACGEYTRYPAENRLSVPICHLTEFGLFEATGQGSGNSKIFLPFISR
jgi:LruC domain-containing protein/uncharacterized repeat protein (TIGR01451 family)